MGRVEILGRGEIQKLYLMLVQYNFYVTQVSAGIMNKQHVSAGVKNCKLETDETMTTKNRKNWDSIIRNIK